jgi:hypothetical protein
MTLDLWATFTAAGAFGDGVPADDASAIRTAGALAFAGHRPREHHANGVWRPLSPTHTEVRQRWPKSVHQKSV